MFIRFIINLSCLQLQICQLYLSKQRSILFRYNRQPMLKFGQLLNDNSDDQKYFSKKNTIQTIKIRKQNRENIFRQRRNLQQLNKKYDERKNQDFLQNQINQLKKQKDKCMTQEEKLILQINKDKLFSEDLYNLQDRDQNIKNLMQNIRSINKLEVYLGLIGMRKLLSLAIQTPIQKAIQHGIIQSALKIAQQEEIKSLKEQATWIIANIASGTTKQCSKIIDAGGIPILIKLMNYDNEDMIEQAIWTLGNISSDNCYFRDIVLKENAIQLLIDVINRFQNPLVIKFSAWTLSNLCRISPLPKFHIIQKAIEKIAEILSQGLIQEEQTFMECCWALSNYCDGQKNQSYFVLENNLFIKVILILKETEKKQIIIPCIRIIGGIALGSHKQIQQLIEHGILQIFQKLLCHSCRIIRRQTSWIISNISASKLQHVQLILYRQNLMKILITMFLNDYEAIRKQIGFIFANLCHKGKSINLDEYYCQIGVVQGFYSLFKSQNIFIIQDSLKAFSYILRFSEQKKSFRSDNINLISAKMISCGIPKLLDELRYIQSREGKIEQIIDYIIQNYVPKFYWEQYLYNNQFQSVNAPQEHHQS